jgi:multiple sugar transport system substrate-binding protein
MRRTLTLLLTVFLLGLVPASARATTKVALWTSEIHPERLAVIHYLADAFMALHPGIRVTVTSVNENDLVHCAQEKEHSAAAPTLINTGGELIAALGEKGHLDTKTAAQFIEAFGRKRFFPGALDFLATPDGGNYGIPHHGWVQGIWYRADWFEKAGLAPPTTWTAILEAARHFTAPKRKTYGILVGTMADMYAEQVFTQIALSNDAAMFSRDGKLIFDSPRMVEALKFYLDLAACAPPGPQTWRGRDYYIQGRMAMLFYSTFIMDDLAISCAAADSLGTKNFKELDGGPFDPTLTRHTHMAPTVHRLSTCGYAMINGFAICRTEDAATRKAALSLLAFLYRPGPYVEWLHMAPGGMLPVVRDMVRDESFIRDPQGVFRRYGRPKIQEILSGLDSLRSFGLVAGRRFPLASIFYAEKIIPRMIVKAKNDDLSPSRAVAWAAEEMRAVAARQAVGKTE